MRRGAVDPLRHSEDELLPRKLVTITEIEKKIAARVKDKDALRAAKEAFSLKHTIKESSGVRIAPLATSGLPLTLSRPTMRRSKSLRASQHRCTDALITENRYDREVHNMSAEWIASMIAANPASFFERQHPDVPRPPVVPHLFAAGSDGRRRQSPKYTAIAVLPVGVGSLRSPRLQPSKTALEKWPNVGQAGGPTLHTPFRKQGTAPVRATRRALYHRFGRASSAGRRRQDVADRQEMGYPGCWVIATIRPFTFDAKMKKGVSFGLQSIRRLPTTWSLVVAARSVEGLCRRVCRR